MQAHNSTLRPSLHSNLVCISECVCGSAKCRVLIAHVCLRTIPLNSHFSHSSTGPPCLINWLSVLEVPLKRDMSATESFSLPQKNTYNVFSKHDTAIFLLTGHTHFHNGQNSRCDCAQNMSIFMSYL